MKLREILDYLTDGELSQLSIGGGDPGQIREEDYPKVIRTINLALVNLFTRFSLKEGLLELVLDPDITRYVLTSAHTVSANVSGQPHYINDSVDIPFKDDLLKIQAIKTLAGKELPFNVLDHQYSCNSPSHDVLEVPSALVLQSSDLPDHYKTTSLMVSYRAAHPQLPTAGTINPDEIEVALPYAYLEPLLYFVAARSHHPSSLTSEVNPATSYYAKYERACQLLQNTNLDLDRDESSTKFRARGWV